jgi:radical SAM protein with 4Fe4S-binding SPASM domain
MNVFRNLPELQNKKYQNYLFYRLNESTFLNKISGEEKLKDIFLPKKSRPVMLLCETVNICNNNCVICAYGKMTRRKETMSLELFEKVLRDYSEMGGGKLSLTPVVGDIFMDKLLVERLDLIKRYPKIISISVTTNAVLSDRYSDNELKHILGQFDKLHISIYGMDEEEYRLITNRSSYLRMISSVKRLIELTEDKNKISFGFRLFKKYSESDMANWIKHNFNEVIPYGYTNSYANWGGVINDNIQLPFSGEWLKKQINCSQCLIPLVACQVFSNGDVSFCSCCDYDIIDDLKLGNIKDQTLSSIYNSKKTRSLWNFSKKFPEFCKMCTFHKPLSDLQKYDFMFRDPFSFIGG